MPQYLSPGVYVEEVESGPKPIEGVSTSMAGAVGVTLRGPTSGKPSLVTSFGEFQRIFGGYIPEPENKAIVNRWQDRDEGGLWWQFPLAVQGFFENGGQQLFVKRVFASTSTSSSAACGRGLVLEIDADANATDSGLKLRHLLGIQVGTQVNIFADGETLSGNPFTVVSLDEGARTISFDDNPMPTVTVGQELRAGRDVVELAANPASPRTPAANVGAETTLTLSAKARGEWGNDLRARVRSMVGATLKLQADPINGGVPMSTTVRVAVAASDTNIKVDSTVGFFDGDRVTINGSPYTLSNVPPLAATTLAAAAAVGATSITIDSITGLNNFETVLIAGTEHVVSNLVDRAETTIGAPPAIGDTTISVASTAGFAANDAVTIAGNDFTINNFTAEQLTTVDAVANAGATTITVAGIAGLANGDAVEIDGGIYVISNVAAGPPATFDIPAPGVPAGATWAVGTQVRRLPTVDISNPAGAVWATGTPVVRRPTASIAPAAGVAWPVATPVQELPAQTTTVSVAALLGDTTITVASVTGLNDGDSVYIGGNLYTLSNRITGPPHTVDVAPALIAAVAVGTPVRLDPPSSFDITPAATAAWPVGTAIRRQRVANAVSAGGTQVLQVRAQGASQLYPGAMVELSNGTQKERFVVSSVNGTTVTFNGPNGLTQQYYEGNKLRVIEAEVSVQYVPGGVIEAEEMFTNLRLLDDGSSSYIATHIEERSDLISVTVGGALSTTDPLDFPVAPAPAPGSAGPGGLWQNMTGGLDNLHDLVPDDFVGADGGSGRRTGIQALEDIDDVSICLVPGIWAGAVRDAMITHCETLRYRFGIIDSPPELEVQEIRTFREPIDTKYAALYYPWIYVRNPSTSRYDRIAPSAHMAGIYARVDTARGVHKAPANEVIRGIRGVNPAKGTAGIAQEITKREQDLLNPEGINALRYFPGRGQRVWGARTVSSDGDWKYINVRRTFIFIERSIDEGTQWVVFEPNDASTWARVRQSVANFLNTQWRNGVLEGATPDEAYYVACERGVTMTQDDIENGRLICEVGIAPVYPAEFVIFRIQKYVAESKLQ